MLRNLSFVCAGLAAWFWCAVSAAQVGTPVSWTGAVNGDWSFATNWSTGTVPNAVGAWAALKAPAATMNVTLDEPVTLGTLEFGNSASPSAGYALSAAGSNTLAMNNGGVGAAIIVDNGAHVVNAPVILADNLTVSGSGTLTFSASSGVTDYGVGYALTKNGPGLLAMDCPTVFSGPTTVNAGTLKAGVANALPAASALTVNSGATFDLDGGNQTVANLSGGGLVTNSGSGSVTLTLAMPQNNSTTWSGTIQDGAGLTNVYLSGSGTAAEEYFSGVNTYHGTTGCGPLTIIVQSTSALGWSTLVTSAPPTRTTATSNSTRAFSSRRARRPSSSAGYREPGTCP